jgi:selenide,water dikinase
VQVVKSLGMNPVPGVRVTLISEQPLAAYSGMLPGCLAGQYPSAQMHIRLLPLCVNSGVRFIQAQVSGLDLQNNRILFDDRPPLAFDIVSLNCGAQPLVAPEQGVAVKPISEFLPVWQTLLDQVQQGRIAKVSVVGAGAGGVELALASRAALPKHVRVELYGPKLLKGP